MMAFRSCNWESMAFCIVAMVGVNGLREWVLFRYLGFVQAEKEERKRGKAGRVNFLEFFYLQGREEASGRQYFSPKKYLANLFGSTNLASKFI